MEKILHTNGNGKKKKAGVTILIIKQKRLYNKTYYKKNISYTITKIGMNPNCP